jgi:hypothetical protein
MVDETVNTSRLCKMSFQRGGVQGRDRQALTVDVCGHHWWRENATDEHVVEVRDDKLGIVPLEIKHAHMSFYLVAESQKGLR